MTVTRSCKMKAYFSLDQLANLHYRNKEESTFKGVLVLVSRPIFESDPRCLGVNANHSG